LTDMGCQNQYMASASVESLLENQSVKRRLRLRV